MPFLISPHMCSGSLASSFCRGATWPLCSGVLNLRLGRQVLRRNCADPNVHFEILSNPEFLAEGTAMEDLDQPGPGARPAAPLALFTQCISSGCNALLMLLGPWTTTACAALTRPAPLSAHALYVRTARQRVTPHIGKHLQEVQMLKGQG